MDFQNGYQAAALSRMVSLLPGNTLQVIMRWVISTDDTALPYAKSRTPPCNALLAALETVDASSVVGKIDLPASILAKRRDVSSGLEQFAHLPALGRAD